MRIRALLAVAALAALALAGRAPADEPKNVTYSPYPPGTIVQNHLVYIAGEAMHSQWHAVTSKKSVGTVNGSPFYQWYLSIYEIDGSVYEMRYQSPKDGPPLSTVKQSSDGKMWFPSQEITIAGQAELMQPGVQQLVVASHEASADCGAALVTVFGSTSGKIVPEVTVQNLCALTAKIAGNTVQLTGPYYNSTAAACCPTKANATATLRYANGQWTVKPDYFKIISPLRQQL